MKIVYIDMDDTLCDFRGAFTKALKESPEMKYPQAQYRFFADLQPIEGAIETVKLLIDSDTYDPYILSAPSTRNPFSYAEKREWVEKHLGFDFCKRLILCAHKGLLRGDILIDDNIEGKGQDRFEGQLIHFGSGAFRNWTSIRVSLGI
ncbi:5' nucleotidase, NT5C type [Marinobacter lipolyticus]|uniref:5' nucleotidase, NT5C type n=1 Tax=Marinobacter lipolyticus TaxID=209639 RepID=UPI003A91996B